MLVVELLETFRVYTRDARANWLTQGVDELMDDAKSEKTILKQSPNYRNSTTPALTIYPEIFYPKENTFWIEISHDGWAEVHETYTGEALPVIKFLIARWPSYAAIQIGDSTFGEIAKEQRPAMARQTEWFHGTTSEHLPTILRLGLNPRNVNQRNYRGLNGSEAGLVYLAANYEASQMHAINAATQFGGAAVVLKVDLRGFEDRIVDDHDVRYTGLGRGNFDSADVSNRRIKQRPGESSFRTLGTIAVKGRIPATHLTVVWTAPSVKKGRMQQKTAYYEFVNQLAMLAKTMPRDNLYDLFHVIAARPSGWTGRKWSYPDLYYTEPEKTINSVFQTHSAPKAFARWLNGMSRRGAKWRRIAQYRPDSPEAKILKLIEITKAALTASAPLI